MRRQALRHTWRDENGNTLFLDRDDFTDGSFAVFLRTGDNGLGFSAMNRTVLREIIGHLQTLDRATWGADPTPLVVPENVLLYREDFIFDIPLGAAMSTAQLVNSYQETDHENVKAAILYLGDSRRENREFDLSRDDRTDAMIPDDEKALMPRDEFGRYYCTIQRRKA